MREKLTVVKIGGNVIDDNEALDSFLKSFSALPGLKILVHGGGKAATEIALQMNVPQQIVNGRRVTDEATLKIVTMVYAGWINKSIVSKLYASGCNAVGFSGADGNLLQAHRRAVKELDYGYVGDIHSVNNVFLCQCLREGYGVVVAPITHDGFGGLLNTNADTIAQCIAVSLSDIYDVQLVYCFEKPGVMRNVANDDSCIQMMDRSTVSLLAQEGIIHSGMMPKISNALQAVEAGVKNVFIGKWDQLNDIVNGQSGTKIICNGALEY